MRPPASAIPARPGTADAPGSTRAMMLPDLQELLALRGAAHGLALHARTPAQALRLGGHRSLQRGRGLEFEEVRPYVAGDDRRSIDWRVTARRGRPHTRVFREERERPVWLLVDLQPGLFFGTRRQLKSAMLVRAAALLAWIAALGGDRVGAVIGDGSRDYRILPPRARTAGVLPLLDALLQLQPRAPAQPRPQCLDGALLRLLPFAHPGSLVLALSDFAALDPAHPGWAQLAAHAQAWLFRATDPIEAAGLPAGRFRVGLPQQLWDLDGAATRERWQALWRQRSQRLTQLSQRLHLPLIRLDTRESVPDCIRSALLQPRSAA